MVNAEFAYLFPPHVKGMQNRHLPPLLRFIPQVAQICIIFARSKFEANPFFRLVNREPYIPLNNPILPYTCAGALHG